MGRHTDAGLASIDVGQVVDLILIAEGREHGDVGGFGKVLQRDLPLAVPIAAADQDQRTFGTGQQALGLFERLRFGRRFGNLRGTGERRRLGQVGQHVLGQGDHHGAGTAGGGLCPGAGEQFGNAFDPVDLDRPFRHRAKDRAVIDLLKRLAFAHVGADLADKEQHGRAVLHRRMHTDRSIGGPWSAGDETDPGLPGQFAPGRRRKGRTAFVPAQDVIQTSGRIMQGVQNGEVTLAGNAEPLGRAESDQALDQKLSAVALHLAAPSCPPRGGRFGRTMPPSFRAGNRDTANRTGKHRLGVQVPPRSDVRCFRGYGSKTATAPIGGPPPCPHCAP